MSVIRAVDGQDTGLSAQPAEQQLQTGIDQDFHLQSALVQASLLLKHQPTGQLKRTRPLTSDPASQSRVLPTSHEAGHVFSPTRKVGSAFFRTHVYCDSSPCFADPALLSVVGFVDCKVAGKASQKNPQVMTSSPVSVSFRPNHEAGHAFSSTRKVGTAFFTTYVYCDSSPSLMDRPSSLVVGFVDEQNTAHLHVQISKECDN